MGVFYGVAAALCWGLGDFLITHLTRRVGTPRALISIQLLSLLAWLGFIVAQPSPPGGSPLVWSIVLGTALCHVLGLIFVYRAFEVGTLSIVSPISAGFAVVTAVLSLASGERPPVMALAGTVLLVSGVVLATRTSAGPAQPMNSKGVPEAILSALAFGTMFWMFYSFVQPKLGYAWPLVVLKTFATGSSVVAYLSKRGTEAKQAFTLDTRIVLLAVGAAAADTLAWLTYIWGSSSIYATVVTALASLFSVVTVLLAWKFLRERLAVHQWAGVGIILCGILLVSI